MPAPLHMRLRALLVGAVALTATLGATGAWAQPDPGSWADEPTEPASPPAVEEAAASPSETPAPTPAAPPPAAPAAKAPAAPATQIAPAPVAAPQAAAPAPAAPAQAAAPAPAPAPAPFFKDTELLPRIDELTAGQTKLNPDDDAPRLLAFLNGVPPTDERYAWAQLHLGRALNALGYSYAASVFFVRIVTERTSPEAVTPALDELASLSRGPHDEAQIQAVFEMLDVNFLPEHLKRLGYYYQGLADLKAGRLRWAKARFARLPRESAEWSRARLADLVTELKNGKPPTPALIESFEKLGKLGYAPRDVRLEAQMAVARLRYERRDFKGALAAYEAVELPPLSPGRAALYLEEAWVRYQMGDLEGSLGRLVAVEAPSFVNAFLPDKHLLRAAIYQEVCHYLPAKRAARELTRRFAKSLSTIRERRPLVEDPLLRRAALSRGVAKRTDDFLQRLNTESDQLERERRILGDELYGYLDRLYGVGLAEATRVRDVKLEAAAEAEANKLLDAVEQVNIIDYEVGLQLYARMQKSPGMRAPKDESALGPEDVGFNFSGEYWNDELRDFRAKLKNRCLTPEQDAALGGG